jgi:hypothetical protein
MEETAPTVAFDETAPVEAWIADRGNFALALAAGLVAALVGAVLWAMVAYVSGYSIGYLALLIGIIVGYAVRRAGRGTGRKYQILGAVLSALGWALGTWLCDIAFLAKEAEQPFLAVLGAVGIGGSFALAARAADLMDILFLAIAVYEGYKFANAARSAKG